MPLITTGAEPKMQGIRQRKSMAMGDGPLPGNDVNIASPASRMMPHPDRDMDTSKTMSDSDRAHTPPTSTGSTRMAMPGTIDHGPHNHRTGKKAY